LKDFQGMSRKWRILGLAACLLTPACVARDSTWERIGQSGSIRVGMDASMPPFASVSSNGTVVGFEVDLVRELGKRMGVGVEFVANLPFDGLYDALLARRVDVVTSALSVNPARSADFAYSTPYFDGGQVAITREPADIRSFDDLIGASVAVELGTIGDERLRHMADDLPGVEVLQYEGPFEAIGAVLCGDVDVALVDHVSALRGIARLGEGHVSHLAVVPQPYAVVMLRQSRTLLEATNDALASLERDGTLESLVDKWLGPDRSELDESRQRYWVDAPDCSAVNPDMR
jgi:ABC-type amino acid transport substrate-binding protein